MSLIWACDLLHDCSRLTRGRGKLDATGPSKLTCIRSLMSSRTVSKASSLCEQAAYLLLSQVDSGPVDPMVKAETAGSYLAPGTSNRNRERTWSWGCQSPFSSLNRLPLVLIEGFFNNRMQYVVSVGISAVKPPRSKVGVHIAVTRKSPSSQIGGCRLPDSSLCFSYFGNHHPIAIRVGNVGSRMVYSV